MPASDVPVIAHHVAPQSRQRHLCAPARVRPQQHRTAIVDRNNRLDVLP